MSDMNIGTVRTAVGLDLAELKKNAAETKATLDKLTQTMEAQAKQAAARVEAQQKASAARQAAAAARDEARKQKAIEREQKSGEARQQRQAESAAKAVTRALETEQREQLRNQRKADDARIREQKRADDILIRQAKKAAQDRENAVKSVVGRQSLGFGAGGGLAGRATGALGFTLAGAAGVTGLVQSAIEMENLEKGLTTIMGSTAAATREMVLLAEAAKLPGVGFREGIAMSTRLQAAKLDANTARNAVIEFGNALTTVGKGKAELDGVALALAQIATGNKVYAEELRQVTERVPQIKAIMKSAFGTADTEIIAKAGIKPLDFIKAIIEAMKELPRAVGGTQNSLDNFNESMKALSASIGKGLIPLLKATADTITPMAERWRKAIEAMSPGELETKMKVFLAVLTAPAVIVGLGALAGALNNIGTALKAIGASAAFKMLPALVIPGAGIAAGIGMYQTMQADRPDGLSNGNPELNLKYNAKRQSFLRAELARVMSGMKEYANIPAKIAELEERKKAIIAEMTRTKEVGKTLPGFVDTEGQAAGKARLDAAKMAADIAAKKKAEKERQARLKSDAASRLAETKRVAQETIKHEESVLKENVKMSQEIARIGKDGFELERLRVAQETEERQTIANIEKTANEKAKQVREARTQSAADAVKQEAKRTESMASFMQIKLRQSLAAKGLSDISNRESQSRYFAGTPNDEFGMYKDKYGNTKYGDRPQDAEMTDTYQKSLIDKADYAVKMAKYTADWEASFRNIERAKDFEAFTKSEMEKADANKRFMYETNQINTAEYMKFLDAQIAAEKQHTERYKSLYTERFEILKGISDNLKMEKEGKEQIEKLSDGFGAGSHFFKNTMRDIATQGMYIFGSTFQKGMKGFLGEIFARSITAVLSNVLETAIEAAFKKQKKQKGIGGGIFGTLLNIFGGGIGSGIASLLSGGMGASSGGGGGVFGGSLGGGMGSSLSGSDLLPTTRMAERSGQAFQSSGASVRFAGAASGANTNNVNINLGGVNVNSRADADYLADRLMVEAERKLRVRY